MYFHIRDYDIFFPYDISNFRIGLYLLWHIYLPIRNTYEESNYLLDPHTATGVRASNNLESKDELVVTMATAHPAKFPSIYESEGMEVPFSPTLDKLKSRHPQFYEVSVDSTSIRSFIIENLRQS